MINLSTRFSSASNLNSKDDRKKRRAVRELFELDDENNLSSFIPLLDDKDSWYRSKALDAFRMWSIRLDTSHLAPLINHDNLEYNRAAANLLEKFDKNDSEIVIQLFDKDDFICKIKSAEFILQFDNQQQFYDHLIASNNAKLRLIALNSKYSSQRVLINSLDDESNIIVNFSLRKLVESDYDISDEKLSKLISKGAEFSNFAPHLIKHNPKKLVKHLGNLDKIKLKIIVKLLNQECDSVDHEVIKLLIENESYVVLGRWLQGRRGDSVDDLRWQIIANDEVDEIERSRLIERLFSRCEEEKIRDMARHISESTTSELIKVTAHNLSTAGDEVRL